MKTGKCVHCMVSTIWVLPAVLSWCIACLLYSSTISLCSSVGIKWESGGASLITPVRQQSYAKQGGAVEQSETTLWRIHPDQEMRATDKKSMIADAILVFGNRKDIITVVVLYGSFPAQSDQSGCTVSSGLAFSLQGSAGVLRLSMKIERNVFYVRGVFKKEEPRSFHQVQAESKEPLSNVQLNFSGVGTSGRAR